MHINLHQAGYVCKLDDIVYSHANNDITVDLVFIKRIV